MPASPAKLFSTFFYLGFLSFAPGTLASLVAVFFFYLVKGDFLFWPLLTALFIFTGFVFSGRMAKESGRNDPSCVVIDEIAGMSAALLFLPCDIKWVLAAFILFRTLDIAKPYPISRIQSLPGSAGIMLDDLAAGCCVNIILQGVLRFISLRGV